MARPPFIISAGEVPEEPGRYHADETNELLGHRRSIGKVAGLLRIGLHLERIGPGERTSYPHCEEKEEEFVFVIDGEIDAWIDGELHPMKPGDLAAFPAGTGICHTFINDGDRDCLLLVGGERAKSDNRIYYPLDPQRRAQLPWSEWWDDVPKRPLGKHQGKPKQR